MKTKTIRDLVPTDVPDILEMYREAFRGYPWFEQLSPETVKERWTSNSLQPDFRCIVVSLDDKQVAGAAWWNSMDQDLLRQERGEELATFATENFPGWPLIWEREVMVFPAFQGKGLGLMLRQEFLTRVKDREKILILTRMRDDNTAILWIGEKVGFKRTGIRMPCSLTPNMWHEYWHLPLTV